MVLEGGGYVVAGMVLANLFFRRRAGVCFIGFCGSVMGAKLRGGICGFWCCFPEVFLSAHILGISGFSAGDGLWRGMEGRGYGAAVLSAFLLPLAREVGVFCVVSIGWHWVVRLPAWDWLRQERKRALGRSSARPGGVAVSVVIAVGSGGGLGLLSGFDVALDGKSF